MAVFLILVLYTLCVCVDVNMQASEKKFQLRWLTPMVFLWFFDSYGFDSYGSMVDSYGFRWLTPMVLPFRFSSTCYIFTG